MAKIDLPENVRPKPLANRTTGYYWELPPWARPKKVRDASGKVIQIVKVERHGVRCPIDSEPLGTDALVAYAKANALNEAFEQWKNGELRIEAVKGTVRWLFVWYRGFDRFKRLDHRTRADYVRLMDIVSDHPMKNGVLGSKAAAKVTAAVADRLYTKFRPILGVRQAKYAMQVCSRVWNEATRHREETGVLHNPFSNMGLSSKTAKGNRETSREEYDLYRKTARAMGLQSMATAAALAFELTARVWDVFGFKDPDGRKARGFPWIGYRPGVSITYTQSKGGKIHTLPLIGRERDGEGGWQVVPLYPELEEELARTPQTADTIVIEERTGKPYLKRYAATVHRRICEKANLPTDMTFTGFRHGGLTELGDAEVDDLRPISGHIELQTTGIYNKANTRKATKAGLKRLAYVREQQSETEAEGASDAA